MLTHAELRAVIDELAPRTVGGQVQKIRQPDAETVVLRVRRPGETVHLVVSCASGAARVAEAEGATTLPEPTALGAWLRAVAGGRALRGLELDENDRVVTLSFTDGRLIAELTGRAANLIAVDAEGCVVALARRDGSGRLSTGQPWTLPPAPNRPPREAEPRFASARAVEAEAQARLARDDADTEAAQRRRAIAQARKRLDRLHAKVSADVARSEGADALRRQGELLKAQAHRVTRGDTEIAVTDWFAEGLPTVVIPLDPTLDGPGNLAALFARYKKAVAGQTHAKARLAEVEDKQLRLLELEEGELPVDALVALLRREGMLPAVQAPGGSRAKMAPRQPFREFRSAAGERVRVGRGGADNHALTFHVARGNDHWLHVRDAPGAHVVVPAPGRGAEPHPETLCDAAALAVHHSDLRG
ncbi:MAG: NFACT family protein, partial [Myxococcales bacterium]|nr:NFACT family protein [Myxococcales bacterium]